MRRIVKAPMVTIHLTGEHWTRLVCLAANSNDRFDWLIQKLAEVFGAVR
jgi:hypothetical protein